MRLFCIVCGAACCTGTTGGGHISFDAFAAGPASVNPAEPYTFTNSRGYQIALSRANLVIGAVYLNTLQPNPIERPTSCTLPTETYVASVRGPLVVNTLSPELQPFDIRGEALVDTALTGQVWLTSTQLDGGGVPNLMVDLQGTAQKNGQTLPFTAQLTIGNNRTITATDPTTPGANPLCQQSIVSPIPISITTLEGGALVLRVDPSGWFFNVDFSTLTPPPAGSSTYAFTDSSGDQASINLYNGVRSSVGVYSFQWTPSSTIQQ